MKTLASVVATAAFLIAIYGIFIAAIIGWVMNIVSLFRIASNGFEAEIAEVVMRIAGMPLAPIGAIIGWM